MIYPPPGISPRCGAQTEPYALYRLGVAPLGCLLGLLFPLLDFIGVRLNVGGMGQRRAIARIREEHFRQNDLTMVCTRCPWTEVGDTQVPG